MGLILYTEEVLDKAWQHDCKERSKAGRAWLHREEYRILFEEMIDEFVATGLRNEKIDLFLPPWIQEYFELETDDR